jgi:hypothetical protein
MGRATRMGSGGTTCGNCGARASGSDVFCGECGAPLTRPLDSPARGAAVGNETYVGKRLDYDRAMRGVEDFDPLGGAFIAAMLRAFAVQSWIASAGFVLLVPFALVLGTSVTVVLGVIYVSVMWLVFVFRPIPVPLSEWKFLVDGQSAAAGIAFEHITWAFRRRRSPVDSLRVRRLAHSMQGSRDYLHVRDGIFSGYVSCFAYGEDLFIGWTFWWSISPFRWFLIAIGRLWQTLTLRGSQLYVIARYEGGKALRDALHAAAREGVDVASGDAAPRGTGTIGSDVAVELVAPEANVPGFIGRAEAGLPNP